MNERQLYRMHSPDIRSEFMIACTFVSRHFRVPAATIYGHRWPSGGATDAAYLAALRLLSDTSKFGETVIAFLSLDEAWCRRVQRAMRHGRRKGFTLRDYRAWRARL